jgi:hypothetical protein
MNMSKTIMPCLKKGLTEGDGQDRPGRHRKQAFNSVCSTDLENKNASLHE